MRSFLIVILTLSSFTVTAQKYSNVIKDTAITNFMNWLLKSDSTFKGIRHVDNDILKLHADNFIYTDSTSLTKYQFAQNIFTQKNKLTQYFNQNDADYFVQQIQKQRKDKWQLKIKGIKLFDTVELVNNRLDKALFSYSLPIFSVDEKYVIIIEGFFCGLVCGSGDYNLYQRQTGNSWKKIKQFNHWDE